MIKVVALIRRNPALSPEGFRDFWTNVHVPMIKERLPGLIRYTGSFPLSSEGTVTSGKEADFDAVVELGFPDRATMERDMGSAGFLAADRVESSAKLMDLAHTRAMVVEEIEVPLNG